MEISAILLWIVYLLRVYVSVLLFSVLISCHTDKQATMIFLQNSQHILGYTQSFYLLLGRINLLSFLTLTIWKSYYKVDQIANHKNVFYVLILTHHKIHLIYLLFLLLLFSFFSFCSFASSANLFSNFLVILLILPTCFLQFSPITLSPFLFLIYIISKFFLAT